MSADKFFLSVNDCRDRLLERLAEPAPGRIQLLSGPRQVGRTTLLLELADHFGARAVYAAADAPEAALPGFRERTFGSAEETAATRGVAVLLLDEAHLLHGWSLAGGLAGGGVRAGGARSGGALGPDRLVSRGDAVTP